jgi:hypothetical protein
MSVQQIKLEADNSWIYEKHIAEHSVFVSVGMGQLGSGSAIHSVLFRTNGG